MRRRNLPALVRSEQMWNPSSDITQLQRTIEQVFEDFLAPTESSFLPRADVEESETDYHVSVDLPGMSKEDVKIEVRGDQIVISGERREEVSEDRSRRMVERFYGAFQRAFTLPQDASLDNIEANFENGVLHLLIPRSEEARPRSIPITESKGRTLERIAKPQEKQKAPEKKTA